MPGREKTAAPAAPVATSTVASNTLANQPGGNQSRRPSSARDEPTDHSQPGSVQRPTRTRHADQLSQHIVKKGDTLEAIARRYGVTIDSLRRANKLRNHLIHPAQILVIPATSVP